MLKERGKRLQLRFNIPNIPENKWNVEWMLKQSLNALISSNIDSTSFQHISTQLKGGVKRFQHSQNRKDVKAKVEAVYLGLYLPVVLGLLKRADSSPDKYE